MVTAAKVVRSVQARGGRLWVTPDGALHASPREVVDDNLSAIIGQIKPAIVAFLREREASAHSDTAGDITAAQLLRECHWQKQPAPCAFFTGYTNDISCRRCGGSWTQHYSTAGEPAETET